MAESVKVNLYTSDNSVARIMQGYKRPYESMVSTMARGDGNPTYEYIGLDLGDLRTFLPKMNSQMPNNASYTVCKTSTGEPIRGRTRGVNVQTHDIVAVLHLRRGGLSWN